MSKQQNLDCDKSSSDDDDDDVLKALKEATDTQFLKESFFKNYNENESNDNDNEKTNNDRNKKIEKEESSSLINTMKKSLRRSDKDDDVFDSDKFNDPFGVTNDYKKFVAKELAKTLDKLLKDDFYFDDEKILTEKNSNKKNENTVIDDSLIGIKLMSDSKERLTIEEIDKEEKDDEKESLNNMIKRKRKLNKGENFNKLLFKCRNVAVEPETVLSKLDTKVWNEKQKGVIYKYKKLNDGTMIEI